MCAVSEIRGRKAPSSGLHSWARKLRILRTLLSIIVHSLPHQLKINLGALQEQPPTQEGRNKVKGVPKLAVCLRKIAKIQRVQSSLHRCSTGGGYKETPWFSMCRHSLSWILVSSCTGSYLNQSIPNQTAATAVRHTDINT